MSGHEICRGDGRENRPAAATGPVQNGRHRLWFSAQRSHPLAGECLRMLRRDAGFRGAFGRCGRGAGAGRRCGGGGLGHQFVDSGGVDAKLGCVAADVRQPEPDAAGIPNSQATNGPDRRTKRAHHADSCDSLSEAVFGEIRGPPLASLDRCLSASVSSRRGARGREGCRGVVHESGCAGTSGDELSPVWTSF